MVSLCSLKLILFYVWNQLFLLSLKQPRNRQFATVAGLLAWIYCKLEKKSLRLFIRSVLIKKCTPFGSHKLNYECPESTELKKSVSVKKNASFHLVETKTWCFLQLPIEKWAWICFQWNYLLSVMVKLMSLFLSIDWMVNHVDFCNL